jgi:hypothetical protein
MTNFDGYSDRYVAEIEYAGYRIAEMLSELGIAGAVVSAEGVDSYRGDLAAVRDKVFAARLEEGYELSYNQMCHGFVEATRLLTAQRQQPNGNG